MVISTDSSGTRRVELCLLLAAAVIVAYQVLVPPVVGLADNGDYVNITMPLRLDPVVEKQTDRYFWYLVVKYSEDTSAPRRFRVATSGILTLLPTVWLSHWWSKDGLYDIRWTGAAHGALFLLSFWLLLPVLRPLSWKKQLLVVGPAMVVFTDVANVSYFNSFYTDTGSLLFLLLTVVFYVRLASGTGFSKANAIGVLICAAFLISSKAQHSLVAFPLVGFLLWQRRRFSCLRRPVFPVTAAALLVLGAVCTQLVPPEYKASAIYNIVFSPETGLLHHAASPADLLAELDLPREAVVYSGTNAFQQSSGMANPQFRLMFEGKASYARLLAYYLEHPGEPSRFLMLGLRSVAYARPRGYGNFTREAGFPPGAVSRAFALWSGAKKLAFDDKPYLCIAFLVLLFTVSGGVSYLFHRQWFPGVLLLIVMAVQEFLISSLGDIAETFRHLFLFQAVVDLLVVSTIAMLVIRIPRPGGAAKELPAKRFSKVAARRL